MNDINIDIFDILDIFDNRITGSEFFVLNKKRNGRPQSAWNQRKGQTYKEELVTSYKIEVV